MENKKQNFIKVANKSNFSKSKCVICPQCKKESIIKKKNNNIIIKCENCHEGSPFNSFEHFQESQKIDLSKIKCDYKNCNNNKSICLKFFRCNTCKINICDSCIKNHFNEYDNHYIINYDDINSYCCIDKEGHRTERYNSYCNQCHVNLCWLCEKDHENHEIILLKSLIIKDNEYIYNQKKVDKLLIDFRKIINIIILILISILKSFELNNRIIDDIKIGFNLESRNYIRLSNNKEINEIKKDMYKHLIEITQQQTIIGFFNKIISLSNQNFNINEINNIYPLNIINNKDIKYFFGEIPIKRMNKNFQENRIFFVRNPSIPFIPSIKNNNEENKKNVQIKNKIEINQQNKKINEFEGNEENESKNQNLFEEPKVVNEENRNIIEGPEYSYEENGNLKREPENVNEINKNLIQECEYANEENSKIIEENKNKNKQNEGKKKNENRNVINENIIEENKSRTGNNEKLIKGNEIKEINENINDQFNNKEHNENINDQFNNNENRNVQFSNNENINAQFNSNENNENANVHFNDNKNNKNIIEENNSRKEYNRNKIEQKEYINHLYVENRKINVQNKIKNELEPNFKNHENKHKEYINVNEKNENINKIQNNNNVIYNQILISKNERNEEEKSMRNLNKINQEKNINHYKSSKNTKEKIENIINISKIYINLIYENEKNEEVIRVFGNYFVNSNLKINCGIIFNNNKIKLKEYFKMNESQLKKLEIIFYAINDIKSAQYMFYDCNSLLSFEVIKWESLITDLSYMFYGCEKLILLTNISKINTENLTNMSYMFFNCISLKEIDISDFITKKVTKMKYLFKGCILLKNVISISNLVTENVEEIQYFFCDCSSLEKICSLNWNTKNVKYLNSSFEGCTSLRNIEGIENWNTSNIINMDASFKNCYSLEDLSGISKWDISKVVTTKETFCNCILLKKVLIYSWKCDNLKDSSFMFKGCVCLEDDSILNILEKAENVYGIVENCFQLISNELSHLDINDKEKRKKLIDEILKVLKKKRPK